MSLKSVWNKRASERWHEPVKPSSADKHWRVLEFVWRDDHEGGEYEADELEGSAGIPACSIQGFVEATKWKTYNYDVRFMCQRCWDLYKQQMTEAAL